MSTLEEARLAQARVRKALEALVQVSGVGIERLPDGFGVKVNLPSARVPFASLPKRLDGVPVRYEVVGKIRPLLAHG